MDLKDYYNQLYFSSVQEIKNNIYITDHFINSKEDDRFGITLLIRPPALIKNKIQKFLHHLKQVEPAQYFYPDTDIHITILSIISCYSGFRLGKIKIEEYEKLIGASLPGIRQFKIHLNGITASSSGVMVRGFPEDASLNNLRDNLRQNFKSSNLEHSIDKRYHLLTAHATVVRFRKKLRNKTAFLDTLDEYHEHDFGTFQVSEAELVYNDWYQRKENVMSLKTFRL